MNPEELDALTRRPGPGRHLATTIVDGQEVATLADIPPLRDRLLFVGRSPELTSIKAGHYQQGRTGRIFWRRLMLAGILPARTPLETADDALLALGHGITDLDKTPTHDDETVDGRLLAGVGPLWRKIALWRPAAVVFIDAGAASIAAGRAISEPWGQLGAVALGGRPCFLIPAPDAPPKDVQEGLNFLRNLAAALPRQRP